MVIRSCNQVTVPVRTGKEVERIVRATRADADFDVVSNPEFLREGSAIEDFMRPDRVVIGTDSERAQELMRYIAPSLIERRSVYQREAELIKYATNAFLATKISFINEVANLCERVGADVYDVSRGIGLDGRIGKKFLHPGRDMADLLSERYAGGADYQVPVRIVEAVVDINDQRKKEMASQGRYRL